MSAYHKQILMQDAKRVGECYEVGDTFLQKVDTTTYGVIHSVLDLVVYKSHSGMILSCCESFLVARLKKPGILVIRTDSESYDFILFDR